MDAITDSAAILATIISLSIAGFQGYWAAGGTKFLAGAWGGQYTELPLRLRVGSAVSVVVFAAAAALILSRAGFWEPVFSFEIVKLGSWIFAAIFVLSSLANFASSSRWERYVNGPSSLALAGLCAVVASSAQPSWAVG